MNSASLVLSQDKPVDPPAITRTEHWEMRILKAAEDLHNEASGDFTLVVLQELQASHREIGVMLACARDELFPEAPKT